MKGQTPLQALSNRVSPFSSFETKCRSTLMPNKIKTDKSLYGDILSLSLAENSRLAYEKGWSVFHDYCASKGIESFKATQEDVANFFLFLSLVPRSENATVKQGEPLSLSTLTLYKSAIANKYNEAGMVSPTRSPKVSAILKGLARYRGQPPRRVKALRDHHVLQMLEKCGTSLIGVRDKAILALGFAAALRRSEICGLMISDIEIIPPIDRWDTKKMFITVRKSKTDQFSKSYRIAVPQGRRIRPIDRLQDWISASGITQGHLFRTMRRGSVINGNPLHHSDIPRLVKKYSSAIGIITSAAVHNARMDKIMEITRHTNPSTVIRYIRDADIFRDHAGENFL